MSETADKSEEIESQDDDSGKASQAVKRLLKNTKFITDFLNSNLKTTKRQLSENCLIV